jgi:predicted amidohydrolase YtcJ
VVGGIGDDWLRIGAVKLFADGSLGSGTAALFAPYADDPSTSGLLVSGDGTLRERIRQVDAAGFQVAVHAIGDRANALVLDALEEIEKGSGRKAERPRVEHAQVVRSQDLARYRALGAIASIQPSHCITDMAWAEKRIGPVRIHDAYRFRSLLEAGIPVAFGTDWSVEPLDPRIGLYAAVTREFRGGGPKGGWHPEEKLTIEEALDLYTRGSAFAEFMEGRKGTLEPGKLADLVVFGADLLALARKDPKAILAAPVEMTVVGGKVVFEAKASGGGIAFR